MLAIRLARVGKKKNPSYRVVVIKLDAERIKYWLGCGAQPSDTVRSFLHNQKIA